MSVYSNIPADAIAELDEWTAAFATTFPTPEELAQERTYAEEQRRQQNYEDYLAAEAQALADEQEAEEEAAAAAASRRRSTYRSKRDGLTQDERAQLRVPTLYEVDQVGDGHWWASIPNVDAIFAAMRVDGRTLRVLSNTGAEYVCRVEDDWSVTCPCEHVKKMREWGHNGLCKHAAVVIAVADFNRAQKASRQPERLAA
jgi:hypothetical protein